MSLKKDFTEGHFDDFIGHPVHVECGSWPHDFAFKSWCPNFRLKTAKGEIRQVRQHRVTGIPSFQIYFEDTKETYVELDLDYVLKYSFDVPLKYHELKAEYIIRKAREASAFVGSSQFEGKDPEEESEDRIDGEDNVSEDPVSTNPAPSHSSKKRGGSRPVTIGLRKKQEAGKMAEKKKLTPLTISQEDADGITIEELIDNSDVESFYEEDDSQSDSDEDNAPDEANDEDANFIAWQRNKEPVQPQKPFTGVSGPQRTLPVETATPFDYFCLFIPIYFWIRFAQYTNSKAGMVHAEQAGKARTWSPTCGAEIKAWVPA